MHLRNKTKNPYEYIKKTKDKIYLSVVTTKPKLIISSDGFFYHDNGDVIKNKFLYERCELLLERLSNLKLTLVCEYSDPINEDKEVNIEDLKSMWDYRFNIIDFAFEIPLKFSAARSILVNLTTTFPYLYNTYYIEIGNNVPFNGLIAIIKFQIEHKKNLNYFMFRTDESLDDYSKDIYSTICYVRTIEKKQCKKFSSYFAMAEERIK